MAWRNNGVINQWRNVESVIINNRNSNQLAICQSISAKWRQCNGGEVMKWRNQWQ
jgi:hypothetical protein